MTEPTTNRSRKITLEELLRLKRHERPGPEYWVRFDRELNEKVWRSLANPPAENSGWLPGWLLRGMRWMTAGAVSTLALVFAWQLQSVTPVASLPAAPFSHESAPVVAATPPAVPSQPVLVASITPVPVEMVAPEKATFAVANLAPSTSPAGYNKIPATMSFSSTQSSSEHYAADTLNTAAFAARWHGSSAY